MIKKMAADLNVTNSKTKLLRYLAVALICLHWTACLWSLVPAMEERGEEDDEPLGWTANPRVDVSTPVQRYVQCFEVCRGGGSESESAAAACPPNVALAVP